jgi:hypothetical protein
VNRATSCALEAIKWAFDTTDGRRQEIERLVFSVRYLEDQLAASPCPMKLAGMAGNVGDVACVLKYGHEGKCQWE